MIWSRPSRAPRSAGDSVRPSTTAKSPAIAVVRTNGGTRALFASSGLTRAASSGGILAPLQPATSELFAGDSARVAIFAMADGPQRGPHETLPRALRGRRLLLARIDPRKRCRGRLGLGRLGGRWCAQHVGTGVDRRARKDGIAMELPVEINVAVGRDDGLGRLAERRRALHRVEGRDIERRVAARSDDTHSNDVAVVA